MSTLRSRILLLTTMLLALVVLPACQPAAPTSSTPATPTPSSLPPTETQLPMAILVNGVGITQVEFEAELTRFQTAQTTLGNSVPLEEATRRVQDELINQVLLEEGARSQGFVVDDALLQSRLDSLVTSVGGMQALTSWEEQNGYNDTSLRIALRRQIAAAWMRDQIIASVANTAEQVHLQQILLYTAEKAQTVWEELNAGADFPSLAAEYDPTTRGELGWIPRNYLPDVQVEEAAFALQPGQYSNVIQTIAGYSILYVEAREADHILSPDAKLTLQTLALENWIKDRRANSTITLAP